MADLQRSVMNAFKQARRCMPLGLGCRVQGAGLSGLGFFGSGFRGLGFRA